MPIYEYTCDSCGTTSEILVRGSNGDQPKCPSCGSPELRKLFSSSYLIKMGHSCSAQAPCGGMPESCETSCGECHEGMGGCAHHN
jgi:putative FmdB family regulatory protein